jgi:hypothetical protein
LRGGRARAPWVGLAAAAAASCCQLLGLQRRSSCRLPERLSAAAATGPVGGGGGATTRRATARRLSRAERRIASTWWRPVQWPRIHPSIPLWDDYPPPPKGPNSTGPIHPFSSSSSLNISIKPLPLQLPSKSLPLPSHTQPTRGPHSGPERSGKPPLAAGLTECSGTAGGEGRKSALAAAAEAEKGTEPRLPRRTETRRAGAHCLICSCARAIPIVVPRPSG